MRTTDGSGLRKRSRGFAAVPNETVFLDPPLSARALGVLTKVIALPLDWDLRIEWLVRQFPEGRDAVQTAVRELRARGFYRVERRRRTDGTFTSGVSVSDVVLPEWVAQHGEAQAAQGTDRPKWDVTLRVLADGRLEDEPLQARPVTGHPDTADVTDGDEADTLTANGFPVTGEPVTGDPVTGSPAVKDRRSTQTFTQGGTSEEVPDVSRGPAPAPPTPTTPSTGTAPPAGEDPEPPERCSSPHPPGQSCRGCGDARRAHQAWEDRQATRRRAAEDAERTAAREARQLEDAARAACRLCDERGLVSVAGGMVRCTHNPSTTTGRGRAEFLAARETEQRRYHERQRPA